MADQVILEQPPATVQPPPASIPSRTAAAPNPPSPAPDAGKTAPPKPGDAPPAPKTDAKRSSIYEAIGEAEPGAEGSTAWPADWREQMASGVDAKAAGVLSRFQSPADLAKAFIAAQQKIRSGEYKRAAPNGDNPEEMKAWRAEQDIPDTADGYEIPMIEGVDLAKLDDNTKESVGLLRGALHGANLSKDQGSKVAQALVDVAQKQMEHQAQADAGHIDATEDDLRSSWGAEYRTNLATNWRFLEQQFGGKAMDILNARMEDGRKLGNLPEFSKSINAMARNNGADILVGGDTGGMKSIDTRIAEIKQAMTNNLGDYYAKGLDKEYMALLEKKEARGGR